MANEGTIRIHRSIGGTGAAFRVTFVPYEEGEEAPAAGERSFHELQQVRAFLKMLGVGAEFIKDALRQLKELQSERRERRKAEMDDAIRLHNTEKMKGLPYDPAPDGFVYATAEIGHEHDRRHRLHLSKIAEQANFDLTKYKKEAA